MLDWQGRLVDAKDRKTISLADIQEDESMAEAMCVGSIEMKAIDDICDSQHTFFNEEEQPPRNVPKECDQVSSVLAGVSPLLDERELCHRLSERG